MINKVFFLSFFFIVSTQAMHRLDMKSMHARHNQHRICKTGHQAGPDCMPAFRSRYTGQLPQVGGWGTFLLFLMCSGILVDQVQAYKPFSEDDLWRCARHPVCCKDTGRSCRQPGIMTSDAREFIEQNIRDCRYCKEQELFCSCDYCDPRYALHVDEFRKRHTGFCRHCWWSNAKKVHEKDDL